MQATPTRLSCPSSCPLPRMGAAVIPPSSHPIPTPRPLMRLSTLFLSLLALVLQAAGPASLPEKERRRREEQGHYGESDSYSELHVSLDDYSEVIDLSSYEELADYGDQLAEVRDTAD